MEVTWKELSDRFRKLGEVTDFNKTSSYDIYVSFNGCSGDITVSLYTYDVADWPRSTCLGQFDNEISAKAATLRKIIEAEQWKVYCQLI